MEVALKELRQSSASALVRFKREIRMLHDVVHPNLVRSYGLHESEGHWFLAMEMVEGVGLREWLLSDGTTRPGEAKLRAAFGQIADGLIALHSEGLVHRDLKPSNIRVRASGQVVLVDFGLVAEIDGTWRMTRGPVGTVSYMAPETAGGYSPGPEADWYAFGVCLYEFLAGRLPFGGDPIDILAAKELAAPPPPSRFADNVPKDLDELCGALLEPLPEARVAGLVVKGLLQAREDRGAVASSVRHAETPPRPLFLGRSEEMDILRDALDRSARGPQTVVVVGDCGIGKTALLDEFVQEVRAARPQALVLRSRCYGNIASDLRLIDDLMDRVACYIQQLEASERAAVLPQDLASLKSHFPVFDLVEEVRKVEQPAGPPAQGWQAAVAGLLAKLAESRSVVFVVDEAHLAGGDAHRQLASMVSAASSVPLCFVVAGRGEGPMEDLTRAAHQVVRLAGLVDNEAQGLLRERVGVTLPERWLAPAVREAGGNPLFLQYYAQALRACDLASMPSQEGMPLVSAMEWHFDRLPGVQRVVVKLVAACPRPPSPRALASMLQAPLREVEEAVARLIKDRILVWDRRGTLELAHEAWKSVALDWLAKTERRELQERIAAGLEDTGDCEPEELASLWQTAGDDTRAANCHLQAADGAHDEGRFDYAARHYRAYLALRNDAATDATRQRCALTLSRTGDFATAAEQLRRRQTGSVACDAAARECSLFAAPIAFAGQGVAPDTGPVDRWYRRLADRVHAYRLPIGVAAQALDQAERGQGPSANNEQAWWRLVVGLLYPDADRPSPGSAFVRRCLAEGTLRPVCRAVSYQLAVQAWRTRQGASTELAGLAKAVQAAHQLGDRRVHAEVELARVVAHWSNGDVEQAGQGAVQVESLALSATEPAPLLTWTARAIHARSMAYTGDFSGHAERTETALERCPAGSLPRTLMVTLGAGAQAYLYQDRPDLARAALQDVEAVALAGEGGIVWLAHIDQAVRCALYEGGGSALAILDRFWKALQRCAWWSFGACRTHFLWLRCSALASASVDESPEGRHTAAEQINRLAAQLHRLRAPGSEAYARWARLQASLLSHACPPGAWADVRHIRCDSLTRHTAQWLLANTRPLPAQGVATPTGDEVLQALAAAGWARPERALRAAMPALGCMESA